MTPGGRSATGDGEQFAPGASEATTTTGPTEFRTVLESMLDLITIERIVRDDDGSIVDFVIEYMNPVQIDVAGRSRDELIGRSVLEVYPAMAGSPLFDAYVEAAESGRPVIIEELGWQDTIDDEEVSGTYTVQIVPFDGGLVVCTRDVSELLAQRQQLSEAFEQLNAAQRLAHIGIWSIDPASNEVSFSDELYRIFGLDEGSAVPPLEDALSQLIHPEDLPSANDLLEQLPRSEEPIAREIRIVTAQGETRRVIVFGTTSTDPQGEADRIWGTAQDVTRQREAEEALREATVSLSHEQAAVALLQRAILSDLSGDEAFELAAIYQPAGGEVRVGGDWYDAFDLGDGRAGLVVGDVAGHGLPAAGLMAQLRNTLRAYALLDMEPAAVLTAVGDLMDRTRTDGLATCLYAVVDPRRGRLVWARAGHLPLAVQRAEATDFLEQMSDPPLGAFRDVLYHQSEISLEAGDLLVLYTDGLIERRGESLDHGLERLRSAIARHRRLAVDAFCQAICSQLLGPDPTEDDTCLLALRVGGPEA